MSFTQFFATRRYIDASSEEWLDFDGDQPQKNDTGMWVFSYKGKPYHINSIAPNDAGHTLLLVVGNWRRSSCDGEPELEAMARILYHYALIDHGNHDPVLHQHPIRISECAANAEDVENQKPKK